MSACIDYATLLQEARTPDGGVNAGLLQDRLTTAWVHAYQDATGRLTELLCVTRGTFEYVFDHYALLEAQGLVPYDAQAEGRLVCVAGYSKPESKKRDDYRLKGWIGPTRETFGDGWDKGHFIGNALGGAVDHSELNVFVQRRDLNRGWSAAGKRYRKMERYCAQHAGTFCFSRPLYQDVIARPAFAEFGLLRPDGEWWVGRFDNRG